MPYTLLERETAEASILSFNKADNSGLKSIFGKCIIPIEEYKNFQNTLNSKLLIMSEDDIDDEFYSKLFKR